MPCYLGAAVAGIVAIAVPFHPAFYFVIVESLRTL